MGALAIHLSRREPGGQEAALRMLAAAPHRGDAHAVELLGSVAFAVTNDPDWITATLARNDRRLAVFCGALDNEGELRAQLGREGLPPPPGETPAAALLAAFARWGEDAVGRLRGSFAGGITDGSTVWCFRDQFGARPLFAHDGPSGFFAATEVKQVLAGTLMRHEPNLDHLHGVVFGGIDRSTAYQGVERIPKSCIARTGADPGIRIQTYWEPGDFVETSRLGPEAALEGTVAALDRAVRRNLTGKDALLLSGGLDSPALGVFAARAEGLANPVQAVTAVYPAYPSVDEREWTEMAATHLGMPLHPFVAEAGSMDDVEHWVKLLDGPVDLLSIPESAESYNVARSLGARTVLNGEAAEFLFECRAFLLDHVLTHGRFRAAARLVGWRRERGVSRARVGREIARAVAPGWLLMVRRKDRPVYLRGVPGWMDQQRMLDTDAGPPLWSRSPRRRWKLMQSAPLMGPGIGFEADETCAAACGVDSRRPFADVDLWEFVLSLPAEVKFPTQRTKPLLRESMRGLLPDALIDRTDKTVFNEFHVAKADYPTLRRLLVEPHHRLEGVDYALLKERLNAGDMIARELQWARDVARIHVFLNQWS